MKKTCLLFIPLTALLVACGELKMGYTSDRRSGLDGSYQISQYSVNSYAYFAGDEVNTTETIPVNFTFEVSKTASNISVEEIDSIIKCDNGTVEYQIKDASNVGTKEGVGLFIGADSTYIDGHLTIVVDKPVKGIIITARRYYSVVNAWNENNIVSDSNVAIAINSSKYVKITGEKDDNDVPVSTDCRFNGQDKIQIEIKVGPQRAFIEKIAFYL